MFALLRHRRDFDVTKLGIEVGPFAHTTVKLWMTPWSAANLIAVRGGSPSSARRDRP
jgi:hypothetical protein